MNTPIIFTSGTVVKAAEGSRLSRTTPWKDDLYVVNAVSVSRSGIEYSVEGSAWHHSLDLIYVSEPTYETLAHVINTGGEEEETEHWDEEKQDWVPDAPGEGITAEDVKSMLTRREDDDDDSDEDWSEDGDGE